MLINLYLSPLEQFDIFTLFSFSVSKFGGFFKVFLLTNLDIACFVAFLELFLVLLLLAQDLFLFPGALRGIVVSFLDAALNMLKGTVGTPGKKFFPVLITIFFFILIFNVLGLIPYGFCATSQIVITQFLGFYAVLGLTFKGIQQLGPKFLNLFIPRNVPALMLPFLSLIEIISYVSRMFSLSIRLFANMVAGHALIHILMAALLGLTSLQIKTWLLSSIFLIPALIIFVILLLETGIAFLQAYVFSVLFLIYMNDSCKSH